MQEYLHDRSKFILNKIKIVENYSNLDFDLFESINNIRKCKFIKISGVLSTKIDVPVGVPFEGIGDNVYECFGIMNVLRNKVDLLDKKYDSYKWVKDK